MCSWAVKANTSLHIFPVVKNKLKQKESVGVRKIHILISTTQTLYNINVYMYV